MIFRITNTEGFLQPKIRTANSGSPAAAAAAAAAAAYDSGIYLGFHQRHPGRLT
jgi:hypothetical protein